MKAYRITMLLAAVIGVSLVQPARADIMASNIPQNGVVSHLEDNNFEIQINPGGSITNPMTGAIGPGSILVGMLRIQELENPIGNPINSAGPTDATITAIFAIRFNNDGSGGTFSFGPLSNSEWSSVGLDALGFNRTNPGTVAIAFDDADNINPNAADSNSNSTNVDDALQTVNGTRLWEFGFDGDSDLFWISVNAPGNSFGAALNVTAGGAGPTLEPIDFATFPVGIPFLPANGNAQVLFFGSAITSGGNGDFQLASDTDFYIQAASPVPEPGSLMIFSLLGGLLVAVVGFRHRKQLSQRAA